MVQLELHYLYEIGRINPTANTILTEMSRDFGLTICPKPFSHLIVEATKVSWTRDPFDRILVAHASLNSDILITADRNIREHYVHARW